jgi:hypothetical protein
LGLFVSSQEDAVRQPLYARFLDEIKALGATDVELVVRWSQTDIHAIEISPHASDSVDDELLTWVMDAARARGLRVFLMPILEIEDRSMGRWRGTLEPSDLSRWWWSYRRFILHYARIAAGHGAALFSVGSELLSIERDRERWLELIADVRKAYSGQLTYSANWDHFEPVSFWDAVDVVGITGYHELSAKPNPTDQELEQGFRPFLHRLRSWALAEGKRYVLTEVGYPSQAHAAQRPWDYRVSGEADALLQLRCYRALYKAFQGDPRLDGVYIWNWFGEGGLDDGSYTPRGKPAEAVLRTWYKASAATVKAPPP